MSDQSFINWHEKIARDIVAQPWLVKKFTICCEYDADTIWHIAKKYNLSYDRSIDIYGCDIFVLCAGIELKKKYIYQCCAKFLHDDIAKIVVGFLWHPQLFINTKKISYI
jgi:hypothetical protein